jgi:hypothetical protein
MMPPAFEVDHARVMDGSRTGEAVIHGPSNGKPVFRPELNYSVAPDAPVLYEGSIRVQALSAADRSRIVGDQDVTTRSYLAAIDHDAPRIPAGAVITFTTTTDGWLAGDQLFVRNGDLGTVRFERHLYAIDDVTATTTPSQTQEGTP